MLSVSTTANKGEVMAKILGYNIDKNKLSAIGAVAGALGIEAVAVDRSRFCEPIGAVADGKTGVVHTDNSGFDHEMLVFCYLSEQQLDMFLQNYRALGLPPIPLKAVLTEHNKYWSAEKLFDELVREHLFMQGSQKQQ